MDPNPAPIVDEGLAKLLGDEPNPTEKFSVNQEYAIFLNLVRSQNIEQGRLVQLNCNHFVITKSLNKAKCPRCGEMIRSGYDYDGFRHRGMADDFSWPDDPLRNLHETDGNQFSSINKSAVV